MLKTRIILIVVSALVIWLIFLLPKVVVENESDRGPVSRADSISGNMDAHVKTSETLRNRINKLRLQYHSHTEKEKNAIFADSLANLYESANQYDSAAWFAEEVAKFFNTADRWIKAGDYYYQAYTLSLNPEKQNRMAAKTQEIYGKILEANPRNLEIKTRLAMTYMSSSNPMQGIGMLREVLAADPKNELALFNLGMLSIQSRQYDLAIGRLEQLLQVNPSHVQGHLLLGIAYMNTGNKRQAREQFEKVKQMEKDPAVHATVDSYLKDLK
ncbi:MAG: tetratricopeptide repeat protein [Bacteroidota bacterium]